MGTFKEYCKKGHLMAETRIIKKSGLSGCGVCTKERARIWWAQNPHKVSEYGRLWKMKNVFNLSIDDYNSILDSQNNCCAICQLYFKEYSRRPAIDHDHSTGKVRGLLCHNCNTALGSFYDNPEYLARAREYLIKPIQ